MVLIIRLYTLCTTQLYYTKVLQINYMFQAWVPRMPVKHISGQIKICLTFPNRYKNFRFSSFSNKMFLPYEFDRPEIIENSYSNFFKDKQKIFIKKI